MSRPFLPPHPQAGFTLIELSIVLVIIGLIAGAIVIGKDLLTAAAIQATVNQIQKYNTAVFTFRDKYGGTPGDLQASLVTQFGMTPRSGANGHGDGNNLLAGCSDMLGGEILQGCETVLFWSDLSVAGLIEGSFTAATDGPGYAFGPVGNYFPPAKLGRANYIMVFSRYSSTGANKDATNYYMITGMSSGTFLAGGIPWINYGVTPLEANAMDSKLDDGLPLTGRITAGENANDYGPATPGAATCAFTGGTQYNTTTSDLADTPLCFVRFQMP